MSFKPTHFNELITEVLQELATVTDIETMYSEDAVELLMMTAAQETHLGRYLRQVKGPALGVFQMEPATLDDLFQYFILKNETLHDAYEYFGQGVNKNNWKMHMKGNLPFQIFLARVNYYRKPGALPSKEDQRAMAMYYKKYWNTHLGAATVEEAIENYRRFAL